MTSDFNSGCFPSVARVTVILFGVFMPLSSGAADNTCLPKTIAQALKRNADALNPVTASWELKRSSRLSLDELLKLLREPAMRGFFDPEYVTLTFQEGKFYYNHKATQWADNKYSEWNVDTRFDGSVMYGGDSTRSRQTVGISDLNYLRTHHPDWNVYAADYFEAAGFEVHTEQGSIDRPPESELLYLVGHGCRVASVKDVTLESKKGVLVGTTGPEGRVTFLLDPAMQYAVVEMHKYSRNGELAQATANSQLIELNSPRVWLPQRSHVINYTFVTIPGKIAKEPLFSTEIVVKELHQNVWPPSRFVIELFQAWNYRGRHA